MTGVIPLVLLWLASRQCAPSQQGSSLPMWPTASSPPPPMPAFLAVRSPAPMPASDANTGTPLSELSQAAATPPPADRPLAPPKPKPKPAAARKPAAKKPSAAARVLRAARGKLPIPGVRASTNVPLPPQKNVSVLQVQTILTKRGVKLVRDGLYGPKTANAWMTLAKQKGLPPLIQRAGPKIAKVVPQTYDVLSVAGIP